VAGELLVAAGGLRVVPGGPRHRHLPGHHVGETAAEIGVSTSTVKNWHHEGGLGLTGELVNDKG
jgi:hypothetical protein